MTLAGQQNNMLKCLKSYEYLSDKNNFGKDIKEKSTKRILSEVY
jgi:hypothetical protein